MKSGPPVSLDANQVFATLESLGARQLKVRGDEVVSTCVFEQSQHKNGFDHTPSMSINLQTGIWQCFGCHKTGKSLRGLVFQWCREYGRDYGSFKAEFDSRDGVGNLRSSVEGVSNARYEDSRFRRRPVAETVAEKLKRLGLDAVECDGQGNPLVDYADDRTKAYVEQNAGRIPQYVVRRGVRVEIAKEANLGYDKTNKRIVFPIYDITGALVGCSTRGIGDKADYKHSTGYKRAYHLYLERETFVNPLLSALIVCEGAFDALVVRGHGYNACALLGSGFSPEQMAVAEKLCDKIAEKFPQVCLVVMMDSDEAGDKAVAEMEKTLNAFPYPVRFARLEKGDPDEATPDELQMAVVKSRWLNNPAPKKVRLDGDEAGGKDVATDTPPKEEVPKEEVPTGHTQGQPYKPNGQQERSGPQDDIPAD